MFPDLTRDDIFRLETRRLWLRWPRALDAAAIRRFASLEEVARMTAHIPHPYPSDAADQFILEARSANAQGRDITLAITLKAGAQDVAGLISVHPNDDGVLEIGYILNPDFQGLDIASEAARALIDAVFAVTMINTIRAGVLKINVASQRVLEKSGFVRGEEILRELPARGATLLCYTYELSRKNWLEHKVWTRPSSMAQQSHSRRSAAEPL